MVIGSIPGVQQCVVCGADDGPAAAVLLQPGCRVTRDQIHHAVNCKSRSIIITILIIIIIVTVIIVILIIFTNIDIVIIIKVLVHISHGKTLWIGNFRNIIYLVHVRDVHC